MNRQNTIFLSSVFLFISLFLFSGLFLNALSVIALNHIVKIFFGVFFVISFYYGSYLYCKNIISDNKKIHFFKGVITVIFVFYIVMLVDFTLIDDSMGRNIFNIYSWNEDAFRNYINNNTNIIPFATIKLFINGYINHKVSLFVCLENIFGNVLAFMPLPFFLKIFAKWCKYDFLNYLTVIIAVFMIEFFQFLFLTGSSDIDDVILNVFGAVLFYKIINVKKISRIISKITLGVWKTDVKKN